MLLPYRIATFFLVFQPLNAVFLVFLFIFCLFYFHSFYLNYFISDQYMLMYNNSYTTLTNFSMTYLAVYKVYTDVGGIK